MFSGMIFLRHNNCRDRAKTKTFYMRKTSWLALIALGCICVAFYVYLWIYRTFGESPVRQWRAGIINELQWVEIRPIAYSARYETSKTFSKVVIVTNLSMVKQLGREMLGSPYPAKVDRDHWICDKWVQMDFHYATNAIGFTIGIHARHEAARGGEICDFGWQGWRTGNLGPISGTLPGFLEQIRASNNIEWVGADLEHVGKTHYGGQTSEYPPGDSRNGTAY